MAIKLPSLIRRKPVFSRSAVRYACNIDGEILLTDSMVSYEGRLIDISAGGAMFRPKLCYLMYRRDVQVQLKIAGRTFPGVIAATNQAGFGIRFDKVIDDATLSQIVGRAVIQEPVAA